MMIKILHILLLVLFMSYNGHAQEGFSKEDIEDIIYEYIMAVSYTHLRAHET